MNLTGLFEDCQSLIKSRDESWHSYFTKWETFAKYEEEVPENELPSKLPVKPKLVRKKRKKQLSLKSTTQSNSKTNVKSRKKVFSKKNVHSNQISGPMYIETFNESSVGDLKITPDDELETILKSVFSNILKEVKKKPFIFAALSQTAPKTDTTDPFNFIHKIQNSFSHNESCLISGNFSYISHNPFNFLMPGEGNNSVFSQNLHKNFNLFESCTKINKMTQIDKKIVGKSFHNFGIHTNLNLHQVFLTENCIQSPQRIQISSDKFTSKLKPLEWDLAHKSLVNTCRKINKEYFIKRAFSKINIIQDEKRFENLYSHKRTNSVSLSLGNSNLVTPKRNPPERKCFSENVLKRKRKYSSKLFFDDTVEDSDSDDQTESASPIICSKSKKTTKPVHKHFEESDSDDCESIFDRVKKF